MFLPSLLVYEILASRENMRFIFVSQVPDTILRHTEGDLQNFKERRKTGRERRKMYSFLNISRGGM